MSIRGTALPGWYVLPAHQRGADQQAVAGPLPPGGAATGAAHGIAGPLSLLATAWRAGITAPGHEEAMSRIAEWLLRRLRKDQYGWYWNGRISPQEELTGASGTPPRDQLGSWCWGTTGIARALQLAGRALGRPQWERTAIEAQRTVFEHPRGRLLLPDAALCHGLGGLLAGAVLIARDSSDALLATQASQVATSVVALFDPAHRFGYQHVLPSQEGSVVPDRPGLTEGAAGVALALLEYATADTSSIREPGAPSWTSLLMLD
jgi:hypothetical protein